MFNPNNWYWIVAGGPANKVFSSFSSAYIDDTNATYISWRDSGGSATKIDTEENLIDVLKEQAPNAVLPTKSGLTTYAAKVRYDKEVAGIIVSGIGIATDDRSKMMIMGGRIAAAADNTWTTEWQGSDGISYAVNAAAMIAISNAVQSHVNDCFATYATVKDSIDAGSITTKAQVDSAFV